MKKCIIVYFSQEGSTKKIADTIAKGLSSKKIHVDTVNLRDNKNPSVQSYDLIGIGFPVYYSFPPFIIMDYIKQLPRLDGKAFFAFTTYGNVRGDASSFVRAIMSKKGARESGFYHSMAANHFLGYTKEGYLYSPDRPSKDELTGASHFGEEIADRLSGASYEPAPFDAPAGLVFRLERFILNQWLTSVVYSRLFIVNKKKCTSCGACIRSCPTGNITKNANGKLVHGRNCLLCLTCEARCPNEAIKSPMTWAINRPIMLINIFAYRKHPEIKYSRVIHRKGKTEHIDRN